MNIWERIACKSCWQFLWKCLGWGPKNLYGPRPNTEFAVAGSRPCKHCLVGNLFFFGSVFRIKLWITRVGERKNNEDGFGRNQRTDLVESGTFKEINRPWAGFVQYKSNPKTSITQRKVYVWTKSGGIFSQSWYVELRTHTQGYKQWMCGLMDLLDTDGNVKVEITLTV